jgi:hypothetical protein
MNTKPILLWPKSRSEVEAQLGHSSDDFLLVDTNRVYELRKLYDIGRATPIFDPFPRRGTHYLDFSNHLVAADCGVHIVGLELCRKVLQALHDPKLARSSIEELLATIAPAAADHAGTTGGTPARLFGSRQGRTILIDWSVLNGLNTAVAAIMVFVAAVTGSMLFPDAGLIAAAVASLVFVALYVGVRISVPGSNRPGRASGAWFETKHLRSSRP